MDLRLADAILSQMLFACFKLRQNCTIYKNIFTDYERKNGNNPEFVGDFAFILMDLQLFVQFFHLN